MKKLISMKSTIYSIVVLSCLVFPGCDRGLSTNYGQVAVVDLDAVARKVGKDKQILQLIEQRQVTLNEQVSATQQSLIEQLNQKKSEFGELNEEETQQLAQMQTKANAILSSTRTQAQSNLTAFQQEVVDRFRAETKPIALEIASKKGCRVVLSKNDSVVFAFDQTIDLTDEVVAALQSKTGPASAAQADAAQTKQAAVDRKAGPKS